VYNRVFSRHTPTYSTLVRSKRLSRLTSQTLNPNSYVTCSKTFRSVASKERRCVAVRSTHFREDTEDKDVSLSLFVSHTIFKSVWVFSRRRTTRSHPLLVLLARVLSTSGTPVRLKIPLRAMRRASRFSRAKGGFVRDIWDSPRTVRPPPSPALLFLENGASRTTGTRGKTRTPSRATACFWITRTYTR
jgi:hypothetical protein